MKNKQPPIPGLEELVKARAEADKKRETVEEVFRPLARLIASLQERVLSLELQLSLLKTQVKKPRETTGGGACYFLSDDRCLGRPADTCRWSVKVGDWEWVCAFPGKSTNDTSSPL